MGRMYGVCRWLQAPCRSQKTGVAQLVERATFNRVVKGSIPFTGAWVWGLGGVGCRVFVRLAQLVEHRSYEPKVESSILSVNIGGGGGGVWLFAWNNPYSWVRTHDKTVVSQFIFVMLSVTIDSQLIQIRIL